MAKPVKHRGKWRIRWLDQDGKRHSEVYDDFRDASFKLREHQQQVDEIKRGLRAAIVPDKTFEDLCDYWLTKRAILKRSRKDDESIIRRHLRPVFGGLMVRDFGATRGVERIDAFLVAKSQLGKKTIANHLTLLITMLNAAVELGWLAAVPRIRKPRVRLFNRDFQYLRTDDELRRFLDAAHPEGELVFALYATAVYTGMREGELAGLHWEDVDFDRRLLTVQRSFDGPTKADDVRYVPILDPLLPVLRSWRLRCGGPIAFPNRDDRMQQPSARVFQEVLHRVLKRAGLQPTTRGGRRKPYVTFHGLRHTFASHWVMRGGDLFKLREILGHKSIQMTMRYAHLSPTAFEGDYSRLGGAGHLSRGTVVDLTAAIGAKRTA